MTAKKSTAMTVRKPLEGDLISAGGMLEIPASRGAPIENQDMQAVFATNMLAGGHKTNAFECRTVDLFFCQPSAGPSVPVNGQNIARERCVARVMVPQAMIPGMIQALQRAYQMAGSL